MGSLQSIYSLQVVGAGIAVASLGVAYVVATSRLSNGKDVPRNKDKLSTSSSLVKKPAAKKRKTAPVAHDAERETTPKAVAVEHTSAYPPSSLSIPGGFGNLLDGTSEAELSTASKGPKSKKKAKPKKAPTSSSNAQSSLAVSSPTLVEEGAVSDELWTKVDRRKAKAGSSYTPDVTSKAPESDAGITTSVTEGDEEDVGKDSVEDEPQQRKTLAEKLLPKTRKTKVDE